MMKKFKAFRDNLTLKQAWEISILIALVITLIAILIAYSKETGVFLIFFGGAIFTFSLLPKKVEIKSSEI